jgi:hypothetical protein
MRGLRIIPRVRKQYIQREKFHASIDQGTEASGWIRGVGDCADLANDAEGRAAAEEWAFPQMCEGSRGKAYADEWRCTNGIVEIKCQ